MKRRVAPRCLLSLLSSFGITTFDSLTKLRGGICCLVILLKTYSVLITPTTANKCGTTLKYSGDASSVIVMQLESICVEAYVGTSVKLTCHVEDVKKPQRQRPHVKWSPPGHYSLSCAPGANKTDWDEDELSPPPIENCNTKYRITTRKVPLQPYVKVSTLEIKSLSEKDGGKYVCEGTVRYGNTGNINAKHIEAGLVVNPAPCDDTDKGNTIVLVCLGVALGLSLLGAGAMALYLLSHRGGGGGGAGGGGVGGMEYGPPTGPASRESLARRSSSISSLRRSRQSSSASRGSSLTSRGSHSRSRSLGGSNIDER